MSLSTGSNDFCHGLTIIVDDKDGMLPLNPTKQGMTLFFLLLIINTLIQP